MSIEQQLQDAGFRKWTTAELRALPDTAVLEDEDKRTWRRHGDASWFYNCVSDGPSPMLSQYRTNSELSRRKLRRIR